MSKKIKKDKELLKLAMITAIISLLNHLIEFLTKIIELRGK